MGNKHVFVSKSTLDISRNRNIRRLEKFLDEQEKNESNSLSKVLSGATKQGGIKSQDDTKQQFTERSASLPVDTHPAYTLGDGFKPNTLLNPQEPLLFCNYLESCNKACFQGTDKYNLCQIRKFKEKYGENYLR